MFYDRLRVISDIHAIRWWDKAADCAPAGEMTSFVDKSDALDFQLLFDGDVFDFWKEPSYKKVTGAWDRFLKRLAAMKHEPILIKGNHDVLPWGRDVSRRLLDDYGLVFRDGPVYDEGHKTLFLHGHRFDSPNKPKRKFGFLVTRALAFLERKIWPDIDKAYHVLKRMIPPNESDVDYAFECAKLAVEYGADTVVFGHTHERDSWAPWAHGYGWYKVHILNSGHCTNVPRITRDFLERVDDVWSLKSFKGGGR